MHSEGQHDGSQTVAGSWTSLQFSRFDSVCPSNAHPNTQWVDGSFSPTGYFMGESGGCFYIVRRCRPDVPKAWDITIYRIPSSRLNLTWAEWTVQVPFRPNAVAVDSEQDLLVIVQSKSHSNGHLYTYRLSSGEMLDSPFVWETILEFQTIIGNIEIKGGVIGLWTRQAVAAIGIPEDEISKVRLRFFHLPTRAMFNVPIEGCEIWGLQFLDEQKVLVSLTSNHKRAGNREKYKHRLRVLSLKTTPDFRIHPDPRLQFFVNLPVVKSEMIQRVLLIPNVLRVKNTLLGTPTQDNPEHRLIGFRYQYTDIGYQTKDIIVLVNFEDLLTRRENAAFLKMKPEEVSGQHFRLCGRRLVWMSGTTTSATIYLRDYNPEIAEACVRHLQGLEGESQTFSNPRNRAWQTKMTPLSSNPSKGHKGVHTESVPQSGIRNLFITQDSLVIIQDERFLQEPQNTPVTLNIYTF